MSPTKSTVLAITALTLAVACAGARNVIAADGLPQGCFARTYDRAHLAAHPDQLVTAVNLSITKASGHYSHDFTMRMRLRGRNETLATRGYCQGEGPGLKCQVECDGGGIYVMMRDGHAMMYLDRVRMAECEQEVIEGGEDVHGGKDDRVFRLDRVPCDRLR